jgi:protease II
MAARIPKADTLFGDIRVDDYYWLRQKTDSAVLRYSTPTCARTRPMTTWRSRTTHGCWSPRH